ncbi:MAG: REP-associated tyrosine transposase [Planctomycetota bacterium]
MEPDGQGQPRRKLVRHYDVQGHAHFLTFSCYGRLPLLGKDRSRRWLVESLEDARQKHAFDLWAWVIMPEHVHLLVWPRASQYQVGRILADIKRPVGQKAIDWLTVHSPSFLNRLTVTHRNRTYRHFWQPGPGQDHNVYDPFTAHQVVEYIHGNPVRRGLVSRSEQWPWSSAADWGGEMNVILKVDRTLPVSNE